MAQMRYAYTYSSLISLPSQTKQKKQVVLETEFDNHAALSLYESLGFIREKRLYRFYLNGKDAFRLVLSISSPMDDDDDVSPEDGSLVPIAKATRRTPPPPRQPYR